VLTNLSFSIPLALEKSRRLVLHATAALPPFIVWPQMAPVTAGVVV